MHRYGGMMDLITKTKEREELLFEHFQSEIIRKSECKEIPSLKIVDKKSKIKKLRKS